MEIDFSPERYEYIEDLVNRYQQGEKEAGLELIEVFRAFTSKYYLMFREGRVNLDDKDTRKFMMLFIPDISIRNSLKKSRHSAATKSEAFKAAAIIRSNCNSISDEDLEQELIEALLTLAKRYRKKGTKKNFAGYLYNSFRFQIYRQLMKTIKDPLSFASALNIPYDDDENITELVEPSLNFIERERLIDMEENELGTNWIYGITASDLFDDLTPFDRLILKLYYIDGLHDYEIAKRSGFHRNWIYRKRHDAIQKIARRMSSDGKQDQGKDN
jgi:RNA polymerase sigma factor (sigma-70 family)